IDTWLREARCTLRSIRALLAPTTHRIYATSSLGVAQKWNVNGFSSRTACDNANPHSAIQFTHFPPSEVRMGNSSSMNCVLPIAPHIRVPVASYQYLLICSPVWQPQLLMNAPLAKARRSICFKSSSCIHAFEELSTTLL